MKLSAAPELEKLGAELIEKHHPALKMVEIGYLFRDEAPNAINGELLFGQAISVDSRNWLFHRKDAMIQISQDLWESMNRPFQELLLDHELCHIGVEIEDDGTVKLDETTGRPKVKLRHHDIQEFHIIMQRYASIYQKFNEFAQKEIERRMSARKKKTLQQVAGTV